MGADLFINSLYEAAMAKYEPVFEKAVKARNAYKEAHPDAQADFGFGKPAGGVDPEYQKLQDAVEAAYTAMHGEGYFRDSYNSTNGLWRYGLSWWEDVTPMLVKGNLTVPRAKKFLKMLESAEFKPLVKGEEGFYGTVDDGENSIEAWNKYFQEKMARLQAFVRKAIELNEAIVCSL